MRLNDAKVVTTFQLFRFPLLLQLSQMHCLLEQIFLLKKGIQEWELAPPAKDVQPPQQILFYVKELQKN